MKAPTLILMDVDQHAGLPFPRSLREFQRLFPGDAACAEYLERVRWGGGFVCPHCGVTGEPFRISTRPGVLACRNCRRQTGLTVGTVMERSHTPLSTWFWAAYLVASQTQGMSAVQFQRQLGLTRYETAFQILHKLRAGMVRRTRIASGVARTNTSKWTKPGSAAAHAAKAEACTTKFWSPAPSRCAIASLEPRGTSETMGAMRGACGWRSPLTEAPNPFADLSMARSLRRR